jgi:hypothetical protein
MIDQAGISALYFLTQKNGKAFQKNKSVCSGGRVVKYSYLSFYSGSERASKILATRWHATCSYGRLSQAYHLNSIVEIALNGQEPNGRAGAQGQQPCHLIPS